eukprot:SAG11_NODE_33805_length_275_cov_0.823864_2_plen_50_part_01
MLQEYINAGAPHRRCQLFSGDPSYDGRPTDHRQCTEAVPLYAAPDGREPA